MKTKLLTTLVFLLFGTMMIKAQSGLVGIMAGTPSQKKDKKTKNQNQLEFEVNNDAGIPIRYGVASETNKTLSVIGGKKYYSDVSELSIPQSVKKDGIIYTVTEIGEKAFGSVMWGGCKIEKITLPSTIIKIGDEAFAFCLKLESLNLPEGLLEIGKKSFCATRSLSKLSIPNSVRIIGEGAFWWGIGGQSSTAEFDNLPLFITSNNCENIGISRNSFETYLAYHPRTSQPTAAQPQPQVVYVQAPQQQPATPVVEKPKAPSSDVDINLPESKGDNSKTFAVIIANENYQEEVKVEYALNDGEMFKQYCQKVLGIPEKNVHMRKDATRNNMIGEISWMQQVAKAYNGEGRFIVYYAGHGIPDESTGVSYLLPVDGKGSMLETGYSLAKFYQTLGEMPAECVTVFMDACFSGAQRGEGMLASARSVAIKAKPQAPQGKMVVFSAAQGDETAYPYKEKEHGMFTYYLLKKLQETRGNVSLDELANYLIQQVSRESIVSNGKSQTPSISASTTMGNEWKTMKLK